MFQLVMPTLKYISYLLSCRGQNTATFTRIPIFSFSLSQLLTIFLAFLYCQVSPA